MSLSRTILNRKGDPGKVRTGKATRTSRHKRRNRIRARISHANSLPHQEVMGTNPKMDPRPTPMHPDNLRDHQNQTIMMHMMMMDKDNPPTMVKARDPRSQICPPKIKMVLQVIKKCKDLQEETLFRYENLRATSRTYCPPMTTLNLVNRKRKKPSTTRFEPLSWRHVSRNLETAKAAVQANNNNNLRLR